MTATPIFQGAATALITPMNASGVDYAQLGRLLDWQVEQGIDAIVIAGTTGEGSTLTDEEHREVLEFSAERVAGQVPMIAGTGSNDTAYAIELSRFACELNYDGLLVVTPYYNKTTQKGLIAMYNAIADECTAPLIVYNVPSRTGVNIEPATYAEIVKHPMITGIKEAGGNISKIVETASLIGDQAYIYSGDDDQVIPIMSMGGRGVISVVSNLMPKMVHDMCAAWFSGDISGAARMQCEMIPLCRSLFCETNPIPVKAAMAAMGWCENYLRLPLVPMEEAHAEVLYSRMREFGLI
ncbi:MAG: 4-hydroxy-tetrahydrodipicolinate synthase [Oscillospiraceae bacterium]|nr:4-hydroxy-tetrahydrodipicolinate synthase [Oscillospiraceae bacterium]